MSTFIKQSFDATTDALLQETTGLELLRRTLQESNNSYLNIPHVQQVNKKVLKLDAIQCQAATIDQMKKLGEGLATLHQIEQPYYGLNEDNFIGRSRQINATSDDWGEFFAESRLAFQVGLIADPTLRLKFSETLEFSKAKLVKFLNRHCAHPSLLHGDLWSGNVLFDSKKVWLIDPAVYYGDREADVAMTELFGGFSAAFYQSYDSVYPRTNEYPHKKVIYNLYHNLNHFNLFGASYLSACEKGMTALQSIQSG